MTTIAEGPRVPKTASHSDVAHYREGVSMLERRFETEEGANRPWLDKYELLLAQQATRDKKVAILRQERDKLEHEKEGCTFSPTINRSFHSVRPRFFSPTPSSLRKRKFYKEDDPDSTVLTENSILFEFAKQ